MNVDVRGDDGPEAALDAQGDKQKQQREAENHFRHDQRRIDRAGEKRARAKAPEAHQRDRSERAVERGDQGGGQRHQQAYADTGDQLRVIADSAAYQRVEKPPHTVTNRDALKL